MNLSPKPYLVALTGGIGSGKTAAAAHFATLGAGIIDADTIAHQLTTPGKPALSEIVAAFGDTILTPEGTLDRAQLRRRVFANPDERRRLEAILHPKIALELRHQIAALTPQYPYLIMVIPLLLETGIGLDLADRILVVDLPESLQIARVVVRSGLTVEEVQQIIATQATRAQRLAIAHDVLPNHTTLDDLHRRVALLHSRYLTEAAQRNR
ncbi:MAG: dephospho-CoA kinase [Hydrogenophilus sp.]|nr:dephospho-CoA kinase [Hydrogenophilus sp.]